MEELQKAQEENDDSVNHEEEDEDEAKKEEERKKAEQDALVRAKPVNMLEKFFKLTKRFPVNNNRHPND